jgi:hypothetical protein
LIIITKSEYIRWVPASGRLSGNAHAVSLYVRIQGGSPTETQVLGYLDPSTGWASCLCSPSRCRSRVPQRCLNSPRGTTMSLLVRLLKTRFLTLLAYDENCDGSKYSWQNKCTQSPHAMPAQLALGWPHQHIKIPRYLRLSPSLAYHRAS